MNEAEYERMQHAQDRSWWFRARRRIIDRVLQDLRLPAGSTLVDVGCGTGANLPTLARHGRAVGVEASPVGAAFAREGTGLEIVEGDAGALPFEDASVDLVALLDVLEHLDDDRGALAEIARILRPGGRLLITVPAWPSLWSAHDEMLHHRRRYRRRPLAALLRGAGLEVDWLSYYNVALFPAVAALRWSRRVLPSRPDAGADGTEVPPAPINAALEAIFAAERAVVGRVRMPFGVSLIGVATRP